MRARISGVSRQMESFYFFIGIELDRTVLNVADNLSAALQSSTVSTSEGQRITITASDQRSLSNCFGIKMSNAGRNLM